MTMGAKLLIILLCIELSLAHHYYNHYKHSDSYSDEDYSEEEEIPKTYRKVLPIERNPQPKRTQTKNFNKQNEIESKDTRKVIPQYEVTENVIDIPNDDNINRRVDTKFVVNKQLNRPANANVNKVSNGDDTKDEKLEKLEREYLEIVNLLSEKRNNRGTHAKTIDLSDIFTKINAFWLNVKKTINNLMRNAGDDVETVSKEIDEADTFLKKLHESGKEAIERVGAFFGGK